MQFIDWLRGFTTGVSKALTSSSPKKRPRRNGPKTNVERLEDRALLTYTTPVLVGGDVVLNGDATSETLILSNVGGFLSHNNLGGTFFSDLDFDSVTIGEQAILVSAVTSITVNGGGGDDQITLNDLDLINAIAVNLDGGTENDAITLDASLGNLNLGGAAATLTARAESISIIQSATTMITTTGSQLYDGDVQLLTDSTLVGTTVTFLGTVTGSNLNSLTITGNAVFGDAATDTVTDLTSLFVLGTTDVSTDTITSVNNQIYNDDVILRENTTLTSANLGDIRFNRTLSSFVAAQYSLTVNTGGITAFGNGGADYVGTNAAGLDRRLLSLMTDAAGTTDFDILPNLTIPSVLTQDDQIYNDDVVLRQDTVLTSNNAGNIAFNSTVTGTTAGQEDLTLTAGTGNVTFAGTVGATRLGAVSVVSAANVTAVAITATSLNQTAGTGTTTLNGPVDTNGAAGVTLTGTNLAVNAAITTTGGGVVTFVETGTVVIAAAGDITADGAVSITGAGGISTAGNVITSDDNVTYFSPVTLTGDVAIDTGAGAGNIAFNSTVTGTTAGQEDLTLTAGTGNVTFAGTVGATRLGAVSVVSAANVTAVAITATSLNQTAGTGTTTLNGPVDTNGAAGVTLTGTNLAVNAAITTTGGGVVTFVETGTVVIAAAGDITADGAVSITGAGGISTAGNVITSDDNVTYFSPVTLTGDVAIDTGAGAGNIAFNSTVTGTTAGQEDLTLTAGTGNVTFAGTVGATRLGAVSVVSAANVTAVAITATSLNQTAGTGTTTLNGPVDTNGAAGVTLTGTNLAVNAAITTTGGGVVTFVETGTVVIAAAGDITADGAVSITGAGGISTAGNVITSDDNVTYFSPVTLTGDVAIDTGAGAGNIAFNSTVTGTTAGQEDLTLTAGTGNVTFAGTVGATRLGAVSVVSAANVTAVAITATSLNQTAGTGTTTLNGPVDTNGAAGVTLTGTNLAVNAAITTTGGGVVTFVETGTVVIAAAGDITADGAVSITGAGGISTAGNVITSDDNVTYFSPVTLTGDVAIDTGAGAGNIAFNSTVTGTTAGQEDLTLTAGTGNVTFAGTVGATRLGAVSVVSAANVTAVAITATSLNQTAGTGTTTLNGPVDTNGAAGVTLTGTNLAVNAAITTTGGGVVTFVETGTVVIAAAGDITADGAVSITGAGGISTAGNVITSDDNVTYFSPVTLTGDVAIDTGAGAGNIAFNSTVTGTTAGQEDLTLTAGTGNVTFAGTVGATRLGAVSVVSAANVTAVAITATSLNQTAGTGTTTLNGPVDTNGAAGVTLTGTNLAVNAAITTTGGGVVTFVETGTVVIAAAGDITADGAVSITGAGGISTAGNVITSDDNVTYFSPVTLTGDVAIDTGAGSQANVRFASTVDTAANALDGQGDLTLNVSAKTTFEDTVGKSMVHLGLGSGSGAAITVTRGNVDFKNDVDLRGTLRIMNGTGSTEVAGVEAASPATKITLLNSPFAPPSDTAAVTILDSGTVSLSDLTILSNAVAGEGIFADTVTTLNVKSVTASDNPGNGLQAIGVTGGQISGSNFNSNGSNGILFTTVSGVTIGRNVGGPDTLFSPGNTISNNGLDGIRIESGTQNSILSNNIFDNGGIGIDLAGGERELTNGMTLNDKDFERVSDAAFANVGTANPDRNTTDEDTGPNNLQNYPEISYIYRDGTDLHIFYSVPTLSSADYGDSAQLTIQFFVSNDVADELSANPDNTLNDWREGRFYINKDAVYDFAKAGQTQHATVPVATVRNLLNLTDVQLDAFLKNNGLRIVATATANGNTSEFSRAAAVNARPGVEVPGNPQVDPSNDVLGTTGFLFAPGPRVPIIDATNPDDSEVRPFEFHWATDGDNDTDIANGNPATYFNDELGVYAIDSSDGDVNGNAASALNPTQRAAYLAALQNPIDTRGAIRNVITGYLTTTIDTSIDGVTQAGVQFRFISQLPFAEFTASLRGFEGIPVDLPDYKYNDTVVLINQEELRLIRETITITPDGQTPIDFPGGGSAVYFEYIVVSTVERGYNGTNPRLHVGNPRIAPTPLNPLGIPLEGGLLLVQGTSSVVLPGLNDLQPDQNQIAFYLVQNGSFDELIQRNPNNDPHDPRSSTPDPFVDDPQAFFSFSGANTDGQNHFRTEFDDDPTVTGAMTDNPHYGVLKLYWSDAYDLGVFNENFKAPGSIGMPTTNISPRGIKDAVVTVIDPFVQPVKGPGSKTMIADAQSPAYPMPVTSDPPDTENPPDTNQSIVLTVGKAKWEKNEVGVYEGLADGKITRTDEELPLVFTLSVTGNARLKIGSTTFAPGQTATLTLNPGQTEGKFKVKGLTRKQTVTLTVSADGFNDKIRTITGPKRRAPRR